MIVDGIAKVKPEQQVVAKPYQPQAAAPQGAAPQQPAASEKKADDAKKEQPEQKPAANA